MIGGFNVKFKWYEKLWIYPLLFIQNCFAAISLVIFLLSEWLSEKFNKLK